MDAAPFTACDVNTERAAVEGTFNLPDGDRVVWALSRSEFGPMSFLNRPEWEVAYNRKQFLSLFDLKIEQVIAPYQQHTAAVLNVTAADSQKGARELRSAPGVADALVTRDPVIVLMTTHGDCMPVWLCAPRSGWIGMAHVGWRGLIAGLIPNFINAVPEGEREGLTFAVGPCISTKHYEVGEEVARLFLNDEILSSAVQIDDKRYYLDLAEGARLQGRAAGVEVMTSAAICTYENRYSLSSFRRDGDLFNPMAAFITRVII